MRKQIESRPLLVLASAFVLALTWRDFPYHLALGFLGFFLSGRKLKVLWALGLVFGVFLAVPSPIEQDRKFSSLIGTVSQVPVKVDGGWHSELHTQNGSFRFYASLKIPFGSRVRIDGVQNRRGTIICEALEKIDDPSAFSRLVQTIRDGFDRYLDRYFPGRLREITDGVCFQVGEFSATTEDDLQRAGLAHLFNVGGVQFLVVALLFDYLVGRSLGRGWLSFSVLISVLLLYALTTGFHPAAARALIIFGLVRLAPLLNRQADLLTCLSVAALVNLVWRPDDLFKAGFQITYLMAALFALYAPRSQKFKNNGVRSLVFVGLGALFSIPLQAFWFQKVNLAGAVSTALVFPCVTALIFANLASFPFLSIGLASISDFFVRQFCVPLLGWILYVLDQFSKIADRFSFSVPHFSGYFLVIFYLGFILVWEPRLRPPPHRRV